MSLYIHIPFCKQACTYCNFHFSTNLSQKELLLAAIRREIVQRRSELPEQPLSSIYFGGGTPSLLSVTELNQIFDTIQEQYAIAPEAEITLEANPDDLTSDKIHALQDTPINRLSIGIQSFFDEALQFMHRAHTADEAMRALDLISNAHFKTYTMDLIYGTPGLTAERWLASLEYVARLGVPHLSAYQLTVEPGTLLAHQIRTHLISEPDDSDTVAQFDLLMDWAAQQAYEHYEISNFARPGHRAMHNSNYWHGYPYLGIGPSAHSFDGSCRSWNIANNARYIKAMANGRAVENSEFLTPADQFNEYLMTGLRTVEGISDLRLRAFGDSWYADFIENVTPFAETGHIELADGQWTLTRAGKHFADRISAACFILDDTELTRP